MPSDAPRTQYGDRGSSLEIVTQATRHMRDLSAELRNDDQALFLPQKHALPRSRPWHAPAESPRSSMMLRASTKDIQTHELTAASISKSYRAQNNRRKPGFVRRLAGVSQKSQSWPRGSIKAGASVNIKRIPTKKWQALPAQGPCASRPGFAR
jgi:hypothetical protein